MSKLKNSIAPKREVQRQKLNIDSQGLGVENTQRINPWGADDPVARKCSMDRILLSATPPKPMPSILLENR